MTKRKSKELKYEEGISLLVGFENLYELLDKLIEKKVVVIFYQGEVFTLKLEEGNQL